jgi:cholesterol transport system auxiliary component
MKRRIVLAAPVILAGCASILPKQKYIARTSWPLDPQPTQNMAANEAGKVVLLRSLDAGPGMSDQAIRTLNPDGSLTASYYNQWAVAPADAASEVLATWLTASGEFSAVISPGSRLAADLIVEGELTELVSDLSRNQARAVLTLVVIQNTHGNTRPLAQQRIIGTAALSGTGYGAQVSAQSAALANAVQQAVSLVTRFA